MNTTKKQTSTRRGVRRVISRLLAAIDRQIKATNDVKKARDELYRIAEKDSIRNLLEGT